MSKTLEDVGLVGDDTFDYYSGHAKYVLINPTGILRALSLFRELEIQKLFTMSIDINRDTLMDYSRKKNVIFCLGTALENYSTYYRSDEISFYTILPRVNKILNYLQKYEEGLTKISCFQFDREPNERLFVKAEKSSKKTLIEELKYIIDVNERNNYLITSEVQTVIDMFCYDKAFYTKELLKNLWGIEI